MRLVHCDGRSVELTRLKPVFVSRRYVEVRMDADPKPQLRLSFNVGLEHIARLDVFVVSDTSLI